MEFIRGEDREQTILLPESIEEYVEENGSVRVIDAYINNLDLQKLGFNRWEPAETGRPSYDPKDILKLYIYGYMNRIRSSRRLEVESKRNMEVIWLLGKLVPDHKTIANFRKDNPEALRNVFRHFVRVCVKMGLYGRELIAIDGSKFKAVNSKARNFTKDKLKDRIERIEAKLDKYFKELEENDAAEAGAGKEKTGGEIQKIIKELNERKITYEGYYEEMEAAGESQKSLTDGESRLMIANGKMDVCYNVQTAVDAKNKLIGGYEVTNNGNDKNLLTPMAKQVQQLFEVEQIKVAADSGYAAASDIAEAIQIGVETHAAGTDNDICIEAAEGEEREITKQANGRCVYVRERNIALCPMGKPLYPSYYKKSGEAVFRNSQACKTCVCPCTAEKQGMRWCLSMKKADFRTGYDDSNLMVKQVHIKPDKEIYKQRKSLVEHPFGTVKRAMDGGYCLTKGKRKTTGEFALLFLAYNLKRAITILGTKKLLQNMSCFACKC